MIEFATPHAPYRHIVSRSIVRRYPAPLTRELLECGHPYETTATGAARDRATQRQCRECAE